MVQIIAHRGSRLLAPENSLIGYQLALAKPINAIDIDVVVTRDKFLVAHHDLYINSDIMYHNRDGHSFNIYQKDSKIQAQYLLKNLNYDELSAYTLQLNRHSNYAKWFATQQDYPNQHIPTLQSVLDYVDSLTYNIPIQIELKTDFHNPEYSFTPYEISRLMYQFIIENNLLSRVKIQSFDWRILYELSVLDKRIKLAFLNCADLVLNYKRYFANSAVLEVISKCDNDLIRAISQMNAYSYEMQDNLLTLAEVLQAHSLSIKVIVWGWPEDAGFLFNPELVNKLLDWGIDSFITDNLDDISDIFLQRGIAIPKTLYS